MVRVFNPEEGMPLFVREYVFDFYRDDIMIVEDSENHSVFSNTEDSIKWRTEGWKRNILETSDMLICHEQIGIKFGTHIE